MTTARRVVVAVADRHRRGGAALGRRAGARRRPAAAATAVVAPRARVPEPPPEAVAAERKLRAVDAGERLLRVDIAVRAAAASLVEGPARIAVVLVGADGAVELVLSTPATLPAPWEGDAVALGAAGVDTDRAARRRRPHASARRAPRSPSSASTGDGRDVLVDLEALGLLAIDAPPAVADAVVSGVAATLASSIFAEVVDWSGPASTPTPSSTTATPTSSASVDGALELAATLVGAHGRAAARQSTFVLRARHTSGEAWEPAVVLVGSAAAAEVSAAIARAACRTAVGVAMVVGAARARRAVDAARSPAIAGRWRRRDLDLVPVGLAASGCRRAARRPRGRLTPPLVADEPAVDDRRLANRDRPPRRGR